MLHLHFSTIRIFGGVKRDRGGTANFPHQKGEPSLLPSPFIGLRQSPLQYSPLKGHPTLSRSVGRTSLEVSQLSNFLNRESWQMNWLTNQLYSKNQFFFMTPSKNESIHNFWVKIHPALVGLTVRQVTNSALVEWWTISPEGRRKID